MSNLSWTVFNPSADWNTIVYLPSFPGEAEKLPSLINPNAVLVIISGFDWNRDLTPWPAPKVFPKGEDFGGQAPALLKQLSEEVIPNAEDGKIISRRGIMGASLAGLFALWAACESDLFQCAASVSGSLWYPGCMEYFCQKLPKEGLSLYLSLGTKEEKTRNPVLRTIGDCTRTLAEHTRTNLVMNPGNHFQDGDQRLANAFNSLTCQSPSA